MKRIAIKGDKENGHKIIQYFKSLGAINKFDYYGVVEDSYYFVDWDFYYYNIIDARTIIPGGYEVFESWNEFEKNYLNKNKMEERNIKISLEKAKEWYKQGGDLREVALQAFSESELTEQFPTSWEEYIRKELHNDNLIEADDTIGSVGYCNFKTEEEAKAFVALGKLIQLRDKYWELDNNWKPDWNDPNQHDMFFINTYYGNVNNKGFSCLTSHVLMFRTSDLRDKFYENFKDLLEQAKMFL